MRTVPSSSYNMDSFTAPVWTVRSMRDLVRTITSPEHSVRDEQAGGTGWRHVKGWAEAEGPQEPCPSIKMSFFFGRAGGMAVEVFHNERFP